MHVVLAWFAARPMTPDARGMLRSRFEASIRDLVPDSYLRYEIGGDDWGVTMLHPGRNPATRWEAVASDERVTGLSLGVPVGAGRDETALTMARRLLAGESIHRDLVPPFGLIAVDRAGEFAVQQDWLGQCRIFTGEADGVTVLSSRPSIVSRVLHGAVEPDLDGWGSYAQCGHFGGELSPIRGARLLAPGERMTGRRGDDGHWHIDRGTHFTVDDVVSAGLATQGRPLETSLEVATAEFTRVAGHIQDQYDDIILGLSGGKDSRLIAASLIAAGRVPRFATNNDIPAEGETARELVRILSEKRGIRIDHTVKLAAKPANVFTHGLRDRVERLQHRYDYQFPYTYAVRPALGTLLPDKADRANITGAGGELATGYWYARPDEKPEPPEIVALSHLIPDVTGIDPDAVAKERERVLAILKRGADLGLEGPHLCDYLYLVERVRRWYSSAYSLSMITPFLHPAMVTVMFSLTAEQKRDRVLHTSLTERLVPEWAEVPFVTGYSVTSTVPKVWEGDGLRVICDLMESAQGPIASLLDRDVTEQMLLAPKGPARKALQRFAYMAVASERLEPATVVAASGETFRRVSAARRAPKRPRSARDRVVARLRWIKRTPVGRAVWRRVRAQVRRR